MTDSQKASLQKIKDGQPIGARHIAVLRDLGYITATRQHSPGLISATISGKGLEALK